MCFKKKIHGHSYYQKYVELYHQAKKCDATLAGSNTVLYSSPICPRRHNIPSN